MPRTGLTKQIIINKSIELIEENSFSNFTIRSLARSLNIKPSSLYNHIINMDSLLSEVCYFSINLLNKELFNAIKDFTKDEAIWQLAITYRKFAKEHPELYNVIINIYKVQTKIVEKNGLEITTPFIYVLDSYPLKDQEKYHFQRILRGILHGFVSQEDAGYFSHYEIDEEETFNLAIKCYIDGLNEYIKKER